MDMQKKKNEVFEIRNYNNINLEKSENYLSDSIKNIYNNEQKNNNYGQCNNCNKNINYSINNIPNNNINDITFDGEYKSNINGYENYNPNIDNEYFEIVNNNDKFNDINKQNKSISEESIVKTQSSGDKNNNVNINLGQQPTTGNECYTNAQQSSGCSIPVKNNNCKTLPINAGNINIKTEETTTGGPDSPQIDFVQIPKTGGLGGSKFGLQKVGCCCQCRS